MQSAEEITGTPPTAVRRSHQVLVLVLLCYGVTTIPLWVLHGLRGLNVRISIDDYGTGYSSLARLRDLPISELKLDRSFVAALTADPRTAAIVESTIQLAHSLGLKLVAEGIETAETLDLLTNMGCDVGQGFHLGRPSAATVITALLISSRTAIGPR